MLVLHLQYCGTWSFYLPEGGGTPWFTEGESGLGQYTGTDFGWSRSDHQMGQVRLSLEACHSCSWAGNSSSNVRSSGAVQVNQSDHVLAQLGSFQPSMSTAHVNFTPPASLGFLVMRQ